MDDEVQKCDLEAAHDWGKLERDSLKTGYRDGISDGRESNFQKSFDKGYSEGFKNGFAIGKYKGTLIANSKLNSSEEINDVLLKKISRGWCQICPDKDVANLNIDEAILKQNEVSKKYLNELDSKYGHKIF